MPAQLTIIGLAGVPNYVPLAFLAAEDKRFYSHGAIDPYGIVRAAWVNHQSGRTVQGASTANGGKLILYTCNGGSNQKWTRK